MNLNKQSLSRLALGLGLALGLMAGAAAQTTMKISISTAKNSHQGVGIETGAATMLLWIGIIINSLLFLSLFINAVKTAPASAITLVAALAGTFLLESFYRWKYRGSAPAAS